MTATAEAKAAQFFAIDCGEHVMSVRHDHDLYRHLAFRHPGTGLYWFDLITWPGFLTIAGDMGSFTFARTDDMLGFFLSGVGINPSYWAEKVQGDRGDVHCYSPELFCEHVEEAWREYADEHGWVLTDVADLWARIDDEVLSVAYSEHHARDAVHEFTWTPEPSYDDDQLGVLPRFEFTDAWEWRLQGYAYRFLYLCHAIRWGAEQYAAAQTVPA